MGVFGGIMVVVWGISELAVFQTARNGRPVRG